MWGFNARARCPRPREAQKQSAALPVDQNNFGSFGNLGSLGGSGILDGSGSLGVLHHSLRPAVQRTHRLRDWLKCWEHTVCPQPPQV